MQIASGSLELPGSISLEGCRKLLRKESSAYASGCCFKPPDIKHCISNGSGWVAIPCFVCPIPGRL